MTGYRKLQKKPLRITEGLPSKSEYRLILLDDLHHPAAGTCVDTQQVGARWLRLEINDRAFTLA